MFSFDVETCRVIELQDVPTRQIQVCIFLFLFVCPLWIWISGCLDSPPLPIEFFDVHCASPFAAFPVKLFSRFSIDEGCLSKVTSSVNHSNGKRISTRSSQENLETCIPASSLQFYLFRGCSWIEFPAYTSKSMTVFLKRISEIQ